MDTDFVEIQNTKFTDPILKEIETVIYFIVQNYKNFIKDSANTHEKIQEFDKEMGDVLERYQQLYNITSNLTEDELQKIAVEFRNEINGIREKINSGFFKGAPFTYSDFTPAQLGSLKVKGDKGDKGAPFTYSDFTPAQLESFKRYNVDNIGGGTTTYNGFAGQDNFIINGNFISWHLGNSYTGAGYGACDLFYNYNMSDFQQKSEFDNKTWIESTTNSAYGGLATKIEKGADKLSGQTVTLSFDYLPSVGDCSQATVTITVEGGNTISCPIPNPTVSGRKSITFTVPAGSYLNKYLLIRWYWSTTSSTTKCYIARVKLERGSVATPFVDRGSLEELLCRRYIQVLKNKRINKNVSGVQYYNFDLPVRMRTSPTLIEATADINDGTTFNLTALFLNSSSITLFENNTTLGFIDINSIKLTAYL